MDVDLTATLHELVDYVTYELPICSARSCLVSDLQSAVRHAEQVQAFLAALPEETVLTLTPRPEPPATDPTREPEPPAA